MLQRTSKTILFLMVGIVIVSFATVAGKSYETYNFEILHHNSTEVGEQIVVTFDGPIDPQRAMDAFMIEPAIAGDVRWVATFNALHFIPHGGFDPGQTYSVTMDIPHTRLASLLPLRSTNTFTSKLSNTILDNSRQASLDVPRITEGKFIDINLYTMTTKMYINGVLVDQVTAAGKGHPYTGATREGLFTIKTKEDTHFSSISHVWMPWSMQYSGNYFIHQWPHWPEGGLLESKFSGGCVRLFPGDAKKVFDFADIGTPVYVHTTVVDTLTQESALLDGDLVREQSSDGVYIVKFINNKKFKRPATTQALESYAYYIPAEGTTKIVPDGTLASYELSHWLADRYADDASFVPFTVGSDGIKRRLLCEDKTACRNDWYSFGWDFDGIFPASKEELDRYPTDLALEPRANWIIRPLDQQSTDSDQIPSQDL